MAESGMYPRIVGTSHVLCHDSRKRVSGLELAYSSSSSASSSWRIMVTLHVLCRDDSVIVITLAWLHRGSDGQASTLRSFAPKI
uniref:Uncharacterized protein n=1 Tax=Rhipicephalus zambeziensis TaxID=60191 RepID=A0A224Y6M8_9ACAR